MSIPTVAQFKAKTKNHKFGQRSRGPNIRKVDAALEAWWKAVRIPGQRPKLEALAGMVSACSRWLKLKQKSADQGLTAIRRQEIRMLGQAALIELGRLGEDATRIDFDRRKLDALGGGQSPRVVRGPGKALSGNYRFERELYLRSGKKHTPSATLLHTALARREYDDGIMDEYKVFRSIEKKDFDQLSQSDFLLFEKLAKANDLRHEVMFLNKNARLEYWAVPDSEGLLTYQRSHERVTSEESRGFAYTWVMDTYGNLFTTAGEKLEKQFNHSSFNAGKNVICGGTLKAEGGKLTYIDNSSGHYKPSMDDLARALWLLAADGADLSECAVSAVTIVGTQVTTVKCKLENGTLTRTE